MILTTRFKRMHSWPIEKLHSLLSRTHQRHTDYSLDTDIDHSEVLGILADDWRRYALEFLASQPTGETVPLSDLADVVAAMENDCSIEAVTSSQRERVYIALYQQHAKHLSAIVDVDTDRMEFVPTVETKRVWAAYCSFCTELPG